MEKQTGGSFLFLNVWAKKECELLNWHTKNQEKQVKKL